MRSERVLTPAGMVPATVVVAAGTIRELAPYAARPAAREVVDAGASAVLPGVVDTHVHVNEPGRTRWEGFRTAGRAAAAGGVTTLVDMPLNSVPVTTDAGALRRKARAAAGKTAVDHAFWGGLIPGNLDEIEALVDAGALGLKAFLVPSGIDEFPAVGERELRPAMALLAELDAPLLAHAEVPGPIAAAIAALGAGDPRSYRRYLASRPPAAEVEAIELLVGLSRETGCRVHVVHVASTEAVAVIAAARAEGLPISAETCPHYLVFAAEEIAAGATAWKCAPPIREARHREALWQALEDGVLDQISSDHSPCPPELKRPAEGDFFAAWGGIASLELMLPAAWTAAEPRGWTLADLARRLCEAPAHLAGLADRKGRLAPGYDADLVLFRPEESFEVDAAQLHQRHPVTPYAGRTLRGRVERTLVRGQTVFRAGAPTGARPGQWLRRSESR